MQPGRELGLVTACILALAASVTSVTSWLESCGPIATTISGTVAGSPNSGVQRTVCQPTADPVVVPGGTSLLLQNLVLPASTVLTAANNTASNGTVAAQLLSLPGVVQLSTGSSQLLLTNVTVQCSCSWLSQLAVALCNELPRLQLASWQVVPDSISVSTWSRSQLSLSNVQFTCPSAQGGAGSSGSTGSSSSPPLLACGVGHAAQWRDVVTLSSSLQAQAARVLVVLDSSVDIPGNASLASIPIYRDVVVMGNPAVQAMLGQTVHVAMDAIRGMNAWTLDTSRGKLTFYNLVFNNLPMGPFEKLPWATFGWGMWAAKTERCSPTSQLVVVDNCTLVLPTSTMWVPSRPKAPEAHASGTEHLASAGRVLLSSLYRLSYMSYWTSELASSFPEKRAAAQWYLQDATCNPSQPRTPLLDQARLNSQVNWYLADARGLGIRFINTFMTDWDPDGLAPGSSAGPTPLALTRMFDNPFTPFPAITWVANASQLVQAMVNSSVRNIAVLANLSVSHTDWVTYVKTTAGNASSNSSDGVNSPNNSNLLLTMTRPVALSGWPDVLTVVDWQGEPGQVQLSADAPLTLRWVTTMNGAPAEGWELGQVLNLTTVFSLPPYVGPLLFIRNQQCLILQDMGVLLWPAVYAAVLKQFDVINTTVRPSIEGPFMARVPFLTDRFLVGYNVTVWSLDGPAQSLGLPFYAIPQPEVVRLAALASNNHSRNRSPAAVVVPAVLVPLAAVAAMVGAVVWWRRRRRALAVAWAANKFQDPEAEGAPHQSHDSKPDQTAPPSTYPGSHSSTASWPTQQQVLSGQVAVLIQGETSSPSPQPAFPTALQGQPTGLAPAAMLASNAAQLSALWNHNTMAAARGQADSSSRGPQPGSSMLPSDGSHPMGMGSAYSTQFNQQPTAPQSLSSQAAGASMFGIGVPGTAMIDFVKEPTLAGAQQSSGPIMFLQPHMINTASRLPAGSRTRPSSVHSSSSSSVSRNATMFRVAAASTGVLKRSSKGRGSMGSSSISSSNQVRTAAATSTRHSAAVPGTTTLSMPSHGGTSAQTSASISQPLSSSAVSSASVGSLAVSNVSGSAVPQPGPRASNALQQAQGQPGGWAMGGSMPLPMQAAGRQVMLVPALGTVQSGSKTSGSDTSRGTGTSNGSRRSGTALAKRKRRAIQQMRPLLQDRDGVVRTMPADPELQATGATCPQAPATGEGTTTDESLGTDSFDKAPETDDALLINRMEMSRDMQRVHLQQPSVAQQLRALVNNMQQELEEQEVEVSRVIGQGGFGVVYQGTWRGLTVAVKTLVFTVLPSMPAGKRQQRAMTEAAICRTMQHPNIVATYAYDLQVRPHQQAWPGEPCMACSPCRVPQRQARPCHLVLLPDPFSQFQALTRPSPSQMWTYPQNTSCTSSKDRDHAPAPAPVTSLLLLVPLRDTEFCDGGPLHTAIDEGLLQDVSSGQPRPATAHVLQLATDIAAGMAHVHSRNVVHGDLTPSNVLLRTASNTLSGFVAKIADFGLSWKLAGGQEHVSNARQGTAYYIAPEVLHVGIMSKPADVFAFGMLLHEMYHGSPAWRRSMRHDSSHTTAAAAAAAAAARLHPGADNLQWEASCPPELKALTLACLRTNPQSRPTFANVTEQLLALQRRLRLAAAEATGLAESAGDLTAFSSFTYHLRSLPSAPGPPAAPTGVGKARAGSVSSWQSVVGAESRPGVNSWPSAGPVTDLSLTPQSPPASRPGGLHGRQPTSPSQTSCTASGTGSPAWQQNPREQQQQQWYAGRRQQQARPWNREQQQQQQQQRLWKREQQQQPQQQGRHVGQDQNTSPLAVLQPVSGDSRCDGVATPMRTQELSCYAHCWSVVSCSDSVPLVDLEVAGGAAESGASSGGRPAQGVGPDPCPALGGDPVEGLVAQGPGVRRSRGGRGDGGLQQRGAQGMGGQGVRGRQRWVGAVPVAALQAWLAHLQTKPAQPHPQRHTRLPGLDPGSAGPLRCAAAPLLMPGAAPALPHSQPLYSASTCQGQGQEQEQGQEQPLPPNSSPILPLPAPLLHGSSIKQQWPPARRLSSSCEPTCHLTTTTAAEQASTTPTPSADEACAGAPSSASLPSCLPAPPVTAQQPLAAIVPSAVGPLFLPEAMQAGIEREASLAYQVAGLPLQPCGSEGVTAVGVTALVPRTASPAGPSSLARTGSPAALLGAALMGPKAPMPGYMTELCPVLSTEEGEGAGGAAAATAAAPMGAGPRVGAASGGVTPQAASASTEGEGDRAAAGAAAAAGAGAHATFLVDRLSQGGQLGEVTWCSAPAGSLASSPPLPGQPAKFPLPLTACVDKGPGGGYKCTGAALLLQRVSSGGQAACTSPQATLQGQALTDPCLHHLAVPTASTAAGTLHPGKANQSGYGSYQGGAADAEIPHLNLAGTGGGGQCVVPSLAQQGRLAAAQGPDGVHAALGGEGTATRDQARHLALGQVFSQGVVPDSLPPSRSAAPPFLMAFRTAQASSTLAAAMPPAPAGPGPSSTPTARSLPQVLEKLAAAWHFLPAPPLHSQQHPALCSGGGAPTALKTSPAQPQQRQQWLWPAPQPQGLPQLLAPPVSSPPPSSSTARPPTHTTSGSQSLGSTQSAATSIGSMAAWLGRNPSHGLGQGSSGERLMPFVEEPGEALAT
ncbi:hypothetical protein QJQ45_020784 [Haematococcus lacustris]|nr:hypothetical protein QJQ45_020784 [Haematococcus lacustris]